ncbi:MAG: hypothetical protein JO316_13435 [Abitibacteriaceae bacterium]|nr:hypothetical protein [Abditibacteriaceae bacterium]
MRIKPDLKWGFALPGVVLLAVGGYHRMQPPDLVGQWTLTNFPRSDNLGNRTLDFHNGGRVTIMNIYARFFRDGTYTFTDARHVSLNFKPGPHHPAETYKGTIHNKGISFSLKNGTTQEFERLDPDDTTLPPNPDHARRKQPVKTSHPHQL